MSYNATSATRIIRVAPDISVNLLLLLSVIWLPINASAQTITYETPALTIIQVDNIEYNFEIPPSTTSEVDFFDQHLQWLKEEQARKESEEKLELQKQEDAQQEQIRLSQNLQINTPVVAVQPVVETQPIGNYSEQITFWCNHFGCDSSQLYRVMMCESGGNPKAYNPSGASGLMQFMPSTFRGNAPRAGVSNPDLWNPSHQIQTAAYMFSIGQSRQWVCN